MKLKLVAVAWFCPALASAEVLDKATLPWDLAPMAATLMLFSICGLLTLWASTNERYGPSARFAAVFLGGAWAAFRAGMDDLYDARFGTALRSELGDLARPYLAVLSLEMVAPLLGIVVLMGLTKALARPA